MKAEFLNPFVFAVMKVLSSEAGLRRWAPDKPYLMRMDSTRHPFSVVIGVTGSVQGIVIYGMDLAIAKGVVKAMAGADMSVSDEVALSALGELANMVTAMASGILAENGYPCRISAPAMVQGTGVRLLPNSISTVVVPINTELGDISICLGLAETVEVASQPAKTGR